MWSWTAPCLGPRRPGTAAFGLQGREEALPSPAKAHAANDAVGAQLGSVELARERTATLRVVNEPALRPTRAERHPNRPEGKLRAGSAIAQPATRREKRFTVVVRAWDPSVCPPGECQAGLLRGHVATLARTSPCAFARF
jgi:hypothetical protein